MRATLPLQQLRKLYRRAAGNLHQTLIPDLVFYFTYWRHSRNMESALLKSKRGTDSAAVRKTWRGAAGSAREASDTPRGAASGSPPRRRRFHSAILSDLSVTASFDDLPYAEILIW